MHANTMKESAVTRIVAVEAVLRDAADESPAAGRCEIGGVFPLD